MTKKNPPCPISGLYAITHDTLDTADLLHKTRQVLQGGAQVLQYRNKLADTKLQFTQAAALRELTQEFNCLFIVNDDVELAQRVDADGVHLGGEDGSVAAARVLLSDDKFIGVSCYNRLSLAQQAEQEGADYVAFGSFFASQVKPHAPVASLDLLQQARRELTLPIVAIGGITLENAPSLFAAGADAVAVISAVFAVPDGQVAARQFANLS
ncbi:MAG: thiamine phosphate synthase [Gallionella sp.]|nr:thiamine phosphate synthase [Gallionella sp.]MDD4960544.1 thiamine phosphate synthase [Gallionella sp.]